MTIELPLQQEALLLALRDEEGTFAGGAMVHAIAGAILSELLLRERIAAADDKVKTVSVTRDEPTGDAILDEVIANIATAKKPLGLQDWVANTAVLRELPHRIADQLCERGILRKDEQKVLWLFTRRIYPELDGSAEDAIRARMARVMFDAPDAPVSDERTLVLIALSQHAGLLKPNFAPDELRQHKKRIEAIADGQLLAADATKAAIQAMQSAVFVAAVLPVLITPSIVN